MGSTPDGRSFLRRGLHRRDFSSFDRNLLVAHRKFLLGAYERTPDNWMVLWGLAKISDALKNPADSLSYWTRCSKSWLISREAFLGMAKAEYAQGNLDCARALYVKAIRRGWISFVCWFPLQCLVSVYVNIRWAPSGSMLKNAFRTQYRILAEAYQGLANICERQGQASEAVVAKGKSEKFVKKAAGLGASCSRNGCS